MNPYRASGRAAAMARRNLILDRMAGLSLLDEGRCRGGPGPKPWL